MLTMATRSLTGVFVVLGMVAIVAVSAEIVFKVRMTRQQYNNSFQGEAEYQVISEPICENVQDIAIVGAGIAGSYAAWRMRNANMTVALYEYSNRIGGRCHTVQFPGIPDVNVELGAMRFKPLEHPKLNKTVHDLGLKVIDFKLGYGIGNDTLFYLRGAHLRYDEIAGNAPYNLYPGHRIDPDTFKWEIFKNYTNVDPSVDGYDKAPKNQFHRTCDGVPLYMQSLRSFNNKFFSSDTHEYLKDINAFDSNFVDVAAAYWLPRKDPALPSVPNPVKTVASGFQSIPMTMVEQFLQASSKHTLHRNHHLKSLKKNKDGHYVLTFQPTQTVRGVTKDIANLPLKHTCARKVLLAIPRIALEELDWEALKNEEIMDYIQNSIKEAKAGKMYFAYSDNWWRRLPLYSPYVVSTTALRQTYDFAKSASTGKAVLNVAYPDFHTEIWRDAQHQGHYVPGIDDDSIAMSNIGVNLGRKMFADIMNISICAVKQPHYAIMQIWVKYPIGASWYTWRSGYIWENVENKMTRPSLEDNVFIISNTFSKTGLQDWTEGALEIVDSVMNKFFHTI